MAQQTCCPGSRESKCLSVHSKERPAGLDWWRHSLTGRPAPDLYVSDGEEDWRVREVHQVGKLHGIEVEEWT